MIHSIQNRGFDRITGTPFLKGTFPFDIQHQKLQAHQQFKISSGTVYIVDRSELLNDHVWRQIFQNQWNDSRYYEIVEHTIRSNFEYRYLVFEDSCKKIRTIQPIFFTQQDLTAGLPASCRSAIRWIRKFSPKFLIMKMLMVWCAAGEGHLGSENEKDHELRATALHEALIFVSRHFGSSIIVLKDFPSFYRPSLAPFSNNGYVRVPSMPAAKLDLNFSSFEDYMQRTLSKSMRKNLRRKFRESARHAPIEMEVVSDITPYVEEIYPLYQQVFSRAKFKFEELTKDYFCHVGQKMADRARFFIWRQSGKIIAFAFCMAHEESLYDNYVGWDYTVALDLHLYFITWRDVIEWAIQNKFKTYYSAPLNYDPKLHLRLQLSPLDLYACHTSKLINLIFRRAIHFLQPARYDPLINRFSNACDLYALSN